VPNICDEVESLEGMLVTSVSLSLLHLVLVKITGFNDIDFTFIPEVILFNRNKTTLSRLGKQCLGLHFFLVVKIYSEVYEV